MVYKKHDEPQIISEYYTMRYIAVVDYGYSIGISGARLIVKNKGEVVLEQALSRIKAVLIAKNGVSISSNSIIALTTRGIKLFISDFKGEIVSCLYNVNNHGSVNVRKNQFKFIDSHHARDIAAQFIVGKIKGQKYVLKYFSKYKPEHSCNRVLICQETADKLTELSSIIKNTEWKKVSNWREKLLGYEGVAASCYWQALVKCNYFGESFKGRVGRNAGDIVNKALNYGYAVLSTTITNAIINAGLELYAGLLHSDVPGKPSLMLDVIEEYRAVVVDKAVIKMRHLLLENKELTPDLKKRLIEEIYTTLRKKQLYNSRKITLESIIQRQVYKLAGAFCQKQHYKSISYKW